jgi:hypothetical protein
MASPHQVQAPRLSRDLPLQDGRALDQGAQFLRILSLMDQQHRGVQRRDIVLPDQIIDSPLERCYGGVGLVGFGGHLLTAFCTLL